MHQGPGAGLGLALALGAAGVKSFPFLSCLRCRAPPAPLERGAASLPRPLRGGSRRLPMLESPPLALWGGELLSSLRRLGLLQLPELAGELSEAWDAPLPFSGSFPSRCLGLSGFSPPLRLLFVYQAPHWGEGQVQSCCFGSRLPCAAVTEAWLRWVTDS